jgi:hypothetical protein
MKNEIVFKTFQMNNSSYINPQEVAFNLSKSIPQDANLANLINEKIAAKDDGYLFRVYLSLKKEKIDLNQYPEQLREVYSQVINKIHHLFDK